MGAPERKLALSHNPLLKEDPMPEVVPEPDASANSRVPRRLMAAGPELRSTVVVVS